MSQRGKQEYLPGIVGWRFQPGDDVPERLASTQSPILPVKTEKVVPARFENAVVALEEVLLLKRYSWRTIKSYKNCFRQFIKHYDHIKPSQITTKQINDYLLMMLRERKISAGHQSQIMSALKMFYRSVYNQHKTGYLCAMERVEKIGAPYFPAKSGSN